MSSQRSWYEFRSREGSNETEILLYDEIGGFGISAASFIAALRSVPASNRIVLRIHSPGGSVLDGHAIFSALKSHPGGVTTHIDGLAASMATVVALAGGPVQMASGAFFMIHNVAAVAAGDAGEMRRMADVVDKIQESIAQVYVDKSGLSRRRIMEMMDAETWMGAEEAMNLGFVDEITHGVVMAAKFDLSAFKNAPRFDSDNEQMVSNETIIADLKAQLAQANTQFIAASEQARSNYTLLNEARTKISELETASSVATASLAEARELNARLTAENTDLGAAKIEAEAELGRLKQAFASEVSAEVNKILGAAGERPIRRDPKAVDGNGNANPTDGLTGMKKAAAYFQSRQPKNTSEN